MKDDITKKMWGIFDETGIFLALCRHGFSLVIADMVRSGELYVFIKFTIQHSHYVPQR
jgi:hypothetical protein